MFALLLAGPSLTSRPGAAENADTVRPPTGTGAAGRSVTLVTGDRVTVRAGRSDLVDIDPGAGREGMRFTTLRTGGHVQVIPADAVALLDKGKLDRRLFDVTQLLDAGYDDVQRDDVPLIVRHSSTQGRARLSGLHVVVGRALPAIGGSAARVVKREASRAWSRLRTAKDVDRIWLDGRRKVSLDRSVPQVGAPVAWGRGLTGAGVDVAVLDTGIDTTHPDLAGRVRASEDFTGEGTDDELGHGTHVASIVAGTGAASDGRYKGVAPDANLMSGKICDSTGWCEESWILAGMRWAAVEQHAKVINLSLGSADTPGIDPAEEAVNTLTAQTGALFVVSAGNADSPWGCRVGSPASADAALAVGAVDDDDALAWFSCTGSRVGDAAMKPASR
ncbi:S8 family serine peptidase [Flindersiella endophytica]